MSVRGGVAMYAAERQQAILARARSAGRVEVGALAEALGVTVETVRRDLSALEKLGAVRRVHGGALPIDRLTLEQDLRVRESQAATEKVRIAARAVAEIPDGGSVVLDAGTTTLAIAHAMPADLAVTAITNSVAIAAMLADRTHVELVVLGGRVRRRTGAAVGEWLHAELSDITADVAFMGTNGFDVALGFTTPDQEEAAAKRAMVSAARRVVVTADSTKAGRSNLHRFAEISQVATLITDSGLDLETAQEFGRLGVEVVRV